MKIKSIAMKYGLKFLLIGGVLFLILFNFVLNWYESRYQISVGDSANKLLIYKEKLLSKTTIEKIFLKSQEAEFEAFIRPSFIDIINKHIYPALAICEFNKLANYCCPVRLLPSNYDRIFVYYTPYEESSSEMRTNNAITSLYYVNKEGKIIRKFGGLDMNPYSKSKRIKLQEGLSRCGEKIEL